MAFVTAIPLTCAPATTPSSTRRFVIRAAKHAQFKGAKKADRCRPKKHRPSDIHRAPPPFNPEPLRAEGLPPVYEIFKPDQADAAFAEMTTLIDADMVAEYEKTLQLETVESDEQVAAAVVNSEPVAEEVLDSESMAEEVLDSESIVEEVADSESVVEEVADSASVAEEVTDSKPMTAELVDFEPVATEVVDFGSETTETTESSQSAE